MSKKTITVKSSDGEVFEVEEAVALQARIVEDILVEEDCYKKEYTLENVTGKILAKVIEYCKKHHVSSGVDLKKWDAEFMDVDQLTIYGLMYAADYLKIESLLVLTCQTVANMIAGKLNCIADSRNDLTSEEEEEEEELP